MKVRFPDILRPFWGKLVWRKDSSEKVIYLTFDDGPVPEVTPQVLQILAQFDIYATFFCVGENVKKYPEVYANVLQSGHKTGNHTFNHMKAFSVPSAEYIENVQKASRYIQNNLFRPPHGQITRPLRKLLQPNFQIIMWDLLTCDYDKTLSPETILKNIKRYSRNGSIVVFHDSIKAKDNVLNVLAAALEWWKSEGYSFGQL
ncbi:MAG: polysaccharide deacetylase family protein [Paludibacter sp.]|jgi:peptidoglycan-N-acetylglucosamine deacetylase